MRAHNSDKSDIGAQKSVATNQVLQLSGLQLAGFLYCVDIGEKNGTLRCIAIIRVLRKSRVAIEKRWKLDAQSEQNKRIASIVLLGYLKDVPSIRFDSSSFARR
jgi:hypothetical protein